MRVGEILLENGWVDRTSLQRAIAEQRHTGKRLCSLLIARGLLDPDHASRALGQLHGVAAVLQRHLEHRERPLALLLPAALARANFALPIGRSRAGDLIVCVRDPRPEVHAALQQATGGTVIMAVAPASQLESLIDMTYDRADADEVDVDLTTGPIAVVGESLPGVFGELSLVGLDDLRVAKDPSQSGSNLRPSMPSISRTMTAKPAASRTATVNRCLTPRALPIGLTLDQTVAALAEAPDQARATDLALRFARTRWTTALLFTIEEDAALGYRGHGPHLTDDVVQAVAIPLSTPTIVKVAHDMRRLATEAPTNAGEFQDRLARMLATSAPTAAPILIANRVMGVLAVGEPLGDPEASSDLDYLVSALGDAYQRILRE
ncbi:MAG TPA: hypothetical protein VIU61_12840 [Kofleriaceae bacterium]